jgi:hypothetical protein
MQRMRAGKTKIITLSTREGFLMAINLKNYTTEVPVSRSQEAIEKLLVQFGATNIMKEYAQDGSGKCTALQFLIIIDKDLKLPFKLQPKVKACYEWLRKKKPNSATKTLMEQAERICWKQLHELTHLQLCQVELDQLEKLEAFFPFLYDVGKGLTYYQQLKEGKFKGLLTAPN